MFAFENIPKKQSKKELKLLYGHTSVAYKLICDENFFHICIVFYPFRIIHAYA